MNLKELAKKLNLSITTVSRALGGYSDVSEKTKQKILKAVKKYNYTPNPYASSLASGKSNTVGFVLPLYDLNHDTLNQTAFFQFITGMSDKLRSEDIQFIMMFAHNESEEKKAYEKLIYVQKVQNIILHNLQQNDPRIKILKDNNINFVAWGRTQNEENFSWVDLDNEGSMKLIVDYLVSKNHKNISFVNIDEKYNFAYQRKIGFKNALKQNSLNYNHRYYKAVKLDDTKKSSQIIQNLLSKNKEITALICASEYSAVGAIKACSNLNLKISKDISLITFDGPVIESLVTPAITCVSHPMRELGYEATKLLLENSNQKFKNSFHLSIPKIIERGSVMKLK